MAPHTDDVTLGPLSSIDARNQYFLQIPQSFFVGPVGGSGSEWRGTTGIALSRMLESFSLTAEVDEMFELLVTSAMASRVGTAQWL